MEAQGLGSTSAGVLAFVIQRNGEMEGMEASSHCDSEEAGGGREGEGGIQGEEAQTHRRELSSRARRP